MRGIVFIGGDAPPPEICGKTAANADIIVAADSGLIAAENAGVHPDWIVGDMDSLDDENRLLNYPADRIIRHPRDKDYTDAELGLHLLWEKGCIQTALIGGGGGRIDHIFALRALFDREKRPNSWITNAETLICVDSSQSPLELQLKPESVVSVFPCGRGRWKAKSRGLRWSLDDLSWDAGFFGISNIAATGNCSITAEKGAFLVIFSLFSFSKRDAPFFL
jgi:thiamine pyrophosphokinase